MTNHFDTLVLNPTDWDNANGWAENSDLERDIERDIERKERT